MSAIDGAKAHFKSLDIKFTEVKEWGEDGNPLKIYYKPMTLAEKNKLMKLAKSDDLEIMAYTIIYKALNKDLKPLFSLEDKRALMHEVDSEVAAELAATLMSGFTVEEQAGN